MFSLANKLLIQSCYASLEYLWKKHQGLFIELFFQEKTIVCPERMVISNLLETGLVRKVNHKIRANVFIFPLSGKFIISDFLISLYRVKDGRYLRRKDDVWPLFAYKSPYLAKKAIVKNDDFVLDLATGSGVIALLCADKAKKVIATDINPKAINYAQFNAILNGLDNKIDFRLGDLFEPVKNEKFDLIIWNGPTLATPNLPEKYPIYCFGGADGLTFTKKFIEQGPAHLNPGGKMQWLDPSLGDGTTPKSLMLVKDLWKDKKFHVFYEQRIKPDALYRLYKIVDEYLLTPTKGLARPLWLKPLTENEYISWIDFLKRNHFTHIHAGMYSVYSSNIFTITQSKPAKVLFPRMNYLPQDWHFLSKSRIRQLVKICESY